MKMDLSATLKCQQVLMLLITLYYSNCEAATTGLLPRGIQCACVGERLIYYCTVVGGGTTVWRGTTFDCPTDGSVITLRHSQFASNQEIGICNNGDIVGRGLAVVNNCYTSQLNLTVRESFANKTVQCISNSNEGIQTVGESLLSVASATNFYPPPDNIYLADVQPGTLVFNWTPVISNCSTLQYNVIASDNCGSCPTVTDMTTATCTDLQLTTDAVLCNFRISSTACSLVGNPSSPITVTLKVPNIPQVEIIPSYSNASQLLGKIFIIVTMNQTEDLFYISGNTSGSPISYMAYGSNTINGTSFNSTFRVDSCEEGSRCQIIEIPSSFCSQSTSINFTILAMNKLGEGPQSNPFMIECTTNFVQVVYTDTSTESTISCEFLNLADMSVKTCCITYGRCNQSELGYTRACNRDFPYNIELEVANRLSQTYCYTVTASNDTYTVKVEGAFVLGDNRRGNSNTAAITAGVVVPIVFILLLLGTGILSLVWAVRRVKNQKTYQPECVEATPLPDVSMTLSPLKQYLTPYSVPDESIAKLHHVAGDWDLQESITDIYGADTVEFRRGHAYYEFENKVENIHEGKDVLLQSKENTKKWFRLAPPEQVAAGGLKLYGEGIAQSNFGDRYRVFIQSFGSGARHLPDNSYILYFHGTDQVEPGVLPLVPVCSEYFAHKVINSEEECTVQQFCTQNGLDRKGFNIFLTVEHLPEGMRDQPPRDAILMDRESKKIFTGPFARQMLDQKSRCESQHENEKWRVFALLEKNSQALRLPLKKGSEVLYQNPEYKSGNYRVLDVDQDYVRMSKFVESKLNCQYEDGKGFYEVTENDPEENLLYCKKILRPQTDMLNREELQLESLVEYFYAIPGVPSKAVKPEQLSLRYSKIFIQSTSQGSRCLKRGTKILYLKEGISLTGDHPGVITESIAQSSRAFN